MNAKDFIALLQDAGWEPRSYSGRAMYGKRCVSVNLDRGVSAAELVADVVVHAYESGYVNVDTGNGGMKLAELFRETKEDSMGLGSVIYWPDLTWTVEDDEEESDDDR